VVVSVYTCSMWWLVCIRVVCYDGTTLAFDTPFVASAGFNRQANTDDYCCVSGEVLDDSVSTMEFK